MGQRMKLLLRSAMQFLVSCLFVGLAAGSSHAQPFSENSVLYRGAQIFLEMTEGSVTFEELSELDRLTVTMFGDHVRAFPAGGGIFLDIVSGERSAEDLAGAEGVALMVFLTRSTSSADIAGFDFSVDDVEDDCAVLRRSETRGSLDCDSYLREVERGCRASLRALSGTLDCDHDLREVERNCEIVMRSLERGVLECR